MASREDLLRAKQALSASLLRAGLRGRVVGMVASLRVDRAIAAATANSNVHAVGIGRKLVEGKATEEMSVRVYVVQKLGASLLPPAYQIPEKLDGIPTDVIESPPAFILPARVRKPDKGAKLGAATGIPFCSSNKASATGDCWYQCRTL